ncbi:hypothetical protein IWX81_002133 [Salinibacterium sp. CAN_S4]|uniref:hypothetical protein n=1 Tax=Salinibacterium sp. CAN_S4 TaxID=2787727 RepID=UPI0018F01ED3
METADFGDQPTPEQARALLAAADAEEHATINRPVPVWYFPVVASGVLVLFSLNAIEEPTGVLRVVTMMLILSIAIGIAALFGKITANQPGYRRIQVTWGPTILMTMLAAAFPVAAIALDGAVGSWVWIVCGAALAVLVLATGIPYQRKHAHG